MKDDQYRALASHISMLNLQLGVLRCVVTVLVSGREPTFDTVWAAVRFSLPVDTSKAVEDEAKDIIRATLTNAAQLRGG